TSSIEEVSNRNIELKSEIEVLKQEILELQLKNKLSEEDSLNSSLIDSNIFSYEGIGWAGIDIEYSDYLKSLVKSILFSDDYFYVEELPESVDNPIDAIKKSNDTKVKLVGITYNSPLISNVTSFPQNIIQTWFSTDGLINYLYLMTVSGDWSSYKVLDGHLIGDYRILQLISDLIIEVSTQPA
ncbi:hypothetical protein AB4Z21_33420, partial [Paenibacillus sp. MCAF20]